MSANYWFYVKSNGNRCWTSPTWAEVQFRSRVGLQLDRNWTSLELHEVIHHRLQSSPSRPNWSPPRRSRVGLQLGRDGLDWSCTRWTSVDSTQGHWVQVQVQRGAAELNLDLDEVALSWSCTRSSTSTLRPSPSRPSWSSTRLKMLYCKKESHNKSERDSQATVQHKKWECLGLHKKWCQLDIVWGNINRKMQHLQ